MIWFCSNVKEVNDFAFFAVQKIMCTVSSIASNIILTNSSINQCMDTICTCAQQMTRDNLFTFEKGSALAWTNSVRNVQTMHGINTSRNIQMKVIYQWCLTKSLHAVPINIDGKHMAHEIFIMRPFLGGGCHQNITLSGYPFVLKIFGLSHFIG